MASTKKVIVTIENGLVTAVSTPRDVDVIIHDYDILDLDLKDSDLKINSNGRKYIEEIWSGSDA